MALEIIRKRIVGTIDNLQEKLNGELPINRLELLYLVNSWGRDYDFYTNENIIIPKCEATQCYDLSKLDTSEIIDMNGLFKYSMFNDIHSANGIGLHNGDISSWNVSSVTNMEYMFNSSSNFNQSLNSWDVSNVKNMYMMFYNARDFNQVLNNWDVSKVKNMDYIFHDAIAFEKRFNNKNPLPNDTNELKFWFNNNRNKMLAIDIKVREKDNLDSFFNNLNNINNDIDSRECNLIK